MVPCSPKARSAEPVFFFYRPDKRAKLIVARARAHTRYYRDLLSGGVPAPPRRSAANLANVRIFAFALRAPRRSTTTVRSSRYRSSLSFVTSRIGHARSRSKTALSLSLSVSLVPTSLCTLGVREVEGRETLRAIFTSWLLLLDPFNDEREFNRSASF